MSEAADKSASKRGAAKRDDDDGRSATGRQEQAAAEQRDAEAKQQAEDDQQDAGGGRPGGRRGDMGPQTGRAAPPEDTARMPASTMVADPKAGPLEPPTDHATQVQPEHGHAGSSTDQIAAEAGRRTIAGENTAGLVDDDDNEVGSGDLFDDDDPRRTWVTARKRVYEQFTYPNTSGDRLGRRLLFVPGQRVPRAQAERIKAAVDAGA